MFFVHFIPQMVHLNTILQDDTCATFYWIWMDMTLNM